MDAIITAGGVPEKGMPLYEETRGSSKCLLEVQGQPMASWVYQAVKEIGCEHVVIVGLEGLAAADSSPNVYFVADQGDFFSNIQAGCRKLLECNPVQRKVLLISGDIPCLTAEMLTWTINQNTNVDFDFQYTVVPRETMETTFPNSRRTYLKMKGIEVCGGDASIIHTRYALAENTVVTELIENRKNVMKQAVILGFPILWRIITGSMTLELAEKLVSKRLKLTGKVVVTPYAELGMDVDKPHQLQLVRDYFRTRRN